MNSVLKRKSNVFVSLVLGLFLLSAFFTAACSSSDSGGQTEVTSIEITSDETSLAVGATLKLKAVVYPRTIENPTVALVVLQSLTKTAL